MVIAHGLTSFRNMIPQPGQDGNHHAPPGREKSAGRMPGAQSVEKVASATFSKELHEIFTSISDEIVGKNFM
ncbi:hypothetical protein, partial [uncultured Pseudoflavonifractor sp.]